MIRLAILIVCTLLLLASIPAIGLSLWAVAAGPYLPVYGHVLIGGLVALVAGGIGCIATAESLDRIF